MDINEVRTYSDTRLNRVEIQLQGGRFEGISASVPETGLKMITVICTEFDWDEIVWQVSDIHTPVDFELLYLILQDIEELYRGWAQEQAANA